MRSQLCRAVSQSTGRRCRNVALPGHVHCHVHIGAPRRRKTKARQIEMTMTVTCPGCGKPLERDDMVRRNHTMRCRHCDAVISHVKQPSVAVPRDPRRVAPARGKTRPR